MMNNGTSASRNGKQDERNAAMLKAEHPDNPREELEITGIGTGVIGPKHEKVRNVARSNILKTQNRTTLKLSPS